MLVVSTIVVVSTELDTELEEVATELEATGAGGFSGCIIERLIKYWSSSLHSSS